MSERSPPEKLEHSSEDVDVSETIILPCADRKLRGERLDFTRKWLAGDIKSWASVQPKPDLLLGGLEEVKFLHVMNGILSVQDGWARKQCCNSFRKSLFRTRIVGLALSHLHVPSQAFKHKFLGKESKVSTQYRGHSFQEPADYEFDECSIGSCSAEVAAINSMDRKKKKIREVPNVIQNVVPPAKPIRFVERLKDLVFFTGIIFKNWYLDF